MVLLDFLTVERGQKGQQEPPIFVIRYSASIITFPWGQPTEEVESIMNLVINLKQRIPPANNETQVAKNHAQLSLRPGLLGIMVATKTIHVPILEFRKQQ